MTKLRPTDFIQHSVQTLPLLISPAMISQWNWDVPHECSQTHRCMLLSCYCSLATSILSLNCGLSAPWKLASHLITFVNHTMMVKRKISLMFTWDMLNKTKEIWQREWKKRREGRKANSALVHDVFFLSPCHQLGKCKEVSWGEGLLGIEGIMHGLCQWRIDLDWLLRITYKYHTETIVPPLPAPFSNPELLSTLCAMALPQWKQNHKAGSLCGHNLLLPPLT